MVQGQGNRRFEMLEVIRDLVAARGYPPTIREIADRMGIASTNTVEYQLGLLERDGLIERTPRTARSIRIVGMKTPAPPKGRRPIPLKFRGMVAFIERFQRENGYPASLRDIAGEFDMSTSVVAAYLCRLEALGVITRTPGSCRSLRLTATRKRAAKVAPAPPLLEEWI